MNRILITALTITGPVIDIGADAAKKLPPGRRYRYSQAGHITLEDGRTFESNQRGLTRPKLAARIASYEDNIRRKMIKAEFDEHGTYFGTSTTYGL